MSFILVEGRDRLHYLIGIALKIFEMTAHLLVGDGERNGITCGVAQVQAYQGNVVGVAWARFIVGEKSAAESCKVGALLRRRLRWRLRWRLRRELCWRRLVGDVQALECQKGVSRFVDSDPMHQHLNMLHVLALLQKVQGGLVLVDDWVRFSVGEQLSDEFGHIVQSGDVVGDIAHGWLAEVWAYGKAPFIFGWNDGRVTNEIAWNGVAVDAVDACAELEFSYWPRHELVG